MTHKKTRQLPLGEHARLYFGDALTIKYQIQEMLRIEKVFEAAGINEELESLQPAHSRRPYPGRPPLWWKYPDLRKRAHRLAELIGIEDKGLALQVEGL